MLKNIINMNINKLFNTNYIILKMILIPYIILSYNDQTKSGALCAPLSQLNDDYLIHDDHQQISLVREGNIINNNDKNNEHLKLEGVFSPAVDNDKNNNDNRKKTTDYDYQNDNNVNTNNEKNIKGYYIATIKHNRRVENVNEANEGNLLPSYTANELMMNNNNNRNTNKRGVFVSRGWGAGGMPFNVLYMNPNHITKSVRSSSPPIKSTTLIGGSAEPILFTDFNSNIPSSSTAAVLLPNPLNNNNQMYMDDPKAQPQIQLDREYINQKLIPNGFLIPEYMSKIPLSDRTSILSGNLVNSNSNNNNNNNNNNGLNKMMLPSQLDNNENNNNNVKPKGQRDGSQPHNNLSLPSRRHYSIIPQLFVSYGWGPIGKK